MGHRILRKDVAILARLTKSEQSGPQAEGDGEGLSATDRERTRLSGSPDAGHWKELAYDRANDWPKDQASRVCLGPSDWL